MSKRNYRILAPLLALLLCARPGVADAQVVSANPLEWMALAEGNEAINGQMENEVDGQLNTAVLQNSIAAEFDQIHRWETKYNQYLKTANGYASQLKACTHLYNDGVRMFLNLCQLRRAVSRNTQGVLASLSMNNLYLETATELVSVYNLLKDAVATGGTANMLTGAERSETLWALSDRLKAFNKKLARLALSIRYYTLNDVWARVSAGMWDRDHAEIAGEALSRWKVRARGIR
jgi:hypothetical protein